jgi:antitoxin MazE
MVKRLTRTGNSLALVIDRPLLDATGIDADTPLDISTNGDVIVISPVRGQNRQARFRAAVDTIHQDYAGVFRRLARS